MYAAWSISYLIALWSTHLLLTATEPFSKRFKWHFQRSLAVSFEYLKDTFFDQSEFSGSAGIFGDWLSEIWFR